MRLFKYLDSHGAVRVGAIEHDSDRFMPLDLSGRQYHSLSDILESDDPASVVKWLAQGPARQPLPSPSAWLPPIDEHEVWAAGVTYRRSRAARMEESPSAADCYDRVYSADRPELFLKATPHRVVGTGTAVRIRADSRWTVPEPEFGIVLNSRLETVGYTIGNDMSARDIEGENPLYLPQAKIYSGCCALGPTIALADFLPTPSGAKIHMEIVRGDRSVFEGTVSVSEMARSFEDLVGYLGRDNTFPRGVVLLTGTGIVPPDEFALAAGDTVRITIDGIGTLSNPVVQG